MARSLKVNGGPTVGTIQMWYFGMSGVGQVIQKDSAKSTVSSYTGKAQEAYDKCIADPVNYMNAYNNYIGVVNTPASSLSAFAEAVEWLNENLAWLWGGVDTGGIAFLYTNDPYHLNDVMVLCSNGLYYNGENYRYYMGAGVEPYRPFNQLATAFFAYMEDSAGITFVTANGDVPFNIYFPGTIDIPPQYIPGGRTSLESFPNTRATTVVELPPFYTHLTAFDLNATNCSGGMNDIATFLDDDTASPLDPTWSHIAGHWYGADSLQPSPDQGGTKPEDWSEPDYEPSEDDRKETTEDQFTTDAVNSGLVTIFNPTADDIRDFSKFLFAGITEDIAAFAKRLVTNPLDYIISLAQVHYEPEVLGASEIKFGGIGSGVSSMIVTKQFQKIDFGSVDIAAQFGGFLDYSGFSRLKIYIPYCGKHEIDCDLSMGATITLNMWVDNLSGACMAQLVYSRGRRHTDDREQAGQVYEFTGNVFEYLPLSAADYRSVVSGALTAAAGIGNVIAGNPGGIGAIASGVMSMKPNIQHAGKTGTNFGYMGSQYAYIEVTRPNPAEPDDYYTYAGYSSATSAILGNLSGFQKVRADGVNLRNIPYITDEEVEELQKILESGVRI